MRVSVMVNRRARHLRSPGPMLETVRSASRFGFTVVETESRGDLERAAAAAADRGDEIVLLAGGDGSYMAGVTALAKAFGESSLPSIGLLPGGTVCTVARNWGYTGGAWPGGAVRHARRLIGAVADGRATTTRRPSLRVTERSPEGDHTRLGFIVGGGLVARFFEIYVGRGSRGFTDAAVIVARIFAGSFGGGALAERVLTPVPCTLAIDGDVVSFDRISLVCASVVRDLGLGMKLLHRAGEREERFHVVATPLEPARLGPQMPRVLAGKPLRGARVDTLARTATLRFASTEGAYVLDGELLRADDILIEAGPVLTVVGLVGR